MSDSKPKFLSDRIGAIHEGEEITIWNRLTVMVNHEVQATQIERHHKILAGDGSTGERPDYITPEMDDQLRTVDVYPNAEVVDPRSEEVEIL